MVYGAPLSRAGAGGPLTSVCTPCVGSGHRPQDVAPLHVCCAGGAGRVWRVPSAPSWRCLQSVLCTVQYVHSTVHGAGSSWAWAGLSCSPRPRSHCGRGPLPRRGRAYVAVCSTVVVIVAVCGSIHSTPRIGAYLYGVYCLVLTHMTQVAGACCEEGMHGSYLGSWRCSCYSCPAGACRIWQLRALALAGVSSSPLPILRRRTEYLTHCARYNISYDMPGRRGHE